MQTGNSVNDLNNYAWIQCNKIKRNYKEKKRKWNLRLHVTLCPYEYQQKPCNTLQFTF